MGGRTAATREMVVLGVDPGLAATGYAVLAATKGRPRLLDCGCARSRNGQPVEARLGAIYEDLARVLGQWRPTLAVLEGLYSDYGFPRTAILMGHVRGVICLAAHQSGARVMEVSPAEVKSALTGSGRASKEQIKRAVTRMLELRQAPKSEHVCDAIALALVGAAREGAIL
jgi:crossover junction endodeoxyribonuclease RuvC